MNCSACGAENRKGAHFCRMCGRDLSQATAADGEAAKGAEELSELTPASVEAVSAVPQETQFPESSADTDVGATTVSPATDTEAAKDAAGQADTIRNPAEAPAPPEQEPAPDVAAGAGAKLSAAEGGAALTAVDNVTEELTPAPPGTVFAGRFLVVEALDTKPDQILYRARDLQQCRQCGFAGNVPSDAFCAQCGAALDPREVQLLEVGDDREDRSGGRGVVGRFAAGDRRFLLLAREEAKTEAPPGGGSMHLVLGQRSDTGRARELDEDSLFVLTLMPTYEAKPGPVLGLLAVADGMGGHEGGEVASKIALQVLTDAALRSVILPEISAQPLAPEAITSRLREAIIAANDAVYLARQKRENDMGTTLTVALIRDDQLFLAHVGDCRAYRWNASGLEQLTTDHSLVASMIASGQVRPEEIYTHPHRSVIYRCIGDKPVVEVDTAALSLTAGDRILLCSDGLWEMVRNEGIEDAMMQEANPQTACDLLVNHANAAGGDDNITVIVVRVEMR